MRKKKLVAYGLVSAALLFGATAASYSYVSGQNNAVTELGVGKYIVTSNNIISTTPSSEEQRIASQLRTELIEKGENVDESASFNLKPDSSYPAQKIFSINDTTKQSSNLNDETTILQYTVKNPSGVESVRNLYLHKVVTQNGVELVPNNTTATPALIPSPDGGKYLFEDMNSIFTIDTKSLSVTQITQDYVDGYDKNKLHNELKEKEQSLFRATNPVWSLDGTQVSYLSNRTAVDNTSMEIWVIDLLNGTERKVYSSTQPVGTFGWTSTKNLIIWEDSHDGSLYSIKELSLKGETSPALLENVDIKDLSRDGKKLLYSPSRPSKDFWVFDIETKEKHQILSVGTGIQFDPTAKFSPEGDKVVALEFAGTKGERIVYVTDIGVGSTQTFGSSDNEIYTATPDWVNNDTLLLNVEKSGESNAKLISVELRGEANE
ncbi:hypothetical protein B1748_34265 [Paenibacillus sp. MY03]|uniref:TolB family protein n=1 Tax=Paenibacillus sp. MY03 TaxID=302980 RepID=UPI000B3BE9FF|nr:PD40 domain-containing protein [Paenibacillus sp. MY03]OUS68242.1 hypothetical protein B1748_34265 [Paenibacillus sp. MY03]